MSAKDKNKKNTSDDGCGLRPMGCAHECSYKSELSTLTPKRHPVSHRYSALIRGKNLALRAKKIH